MGTPHLTTVSGDPTQSPVVAGEVFDFSRASETGAQRIRRLQLETRALAREQVEALARDLLAMAERAAEVAAGGEIYPVGVRELATRVAEDLPNKALVMMSIAGRDVPRG